MMHAGYTREQTVKRDPLGIVERNVARLQEKINVLRRSK